jgi:RND family efflux transporter MFP subunit
MKHTNWMVVVVTIVLFSGCAQLVEPSEKVIPKVKTQKVSVTSKKIQHEFPGLLKESRNVSLAFRVAGPVQSIKIKEGDFVQKGQLIATIDPRDYQLQYNVAKAEYDKVITETQRVKQLYQKQSVTDVDYQKALAGEKMISEKLNHATNQLNDTRLMAPFSGYIQKINFEAGELINTGMPLATLIDVNSFVVECDVPASLLNQINKETQYQLKSNLIQHQPVSLTLINYLKKANSSQLYRFQFNLGQEQSKELKAGMAVAVLISCRCTSQNQLSVPAEAIFNRNSKPQVWVYNTKTSTIQAYEVKTGALLQNGYIEIQEGLKPEDTVVVAGVNNLNNNDTVKVIQPISETNQGGLL